MKYYNLLPWNTSSNNCISQLKTEKDNTRIYILLCSHNMLSYKLANHFLVKVIKCGLQTIIAEFIYNEQHYDLVWCVNPTCELMPYSGTLMIGAWIIMEKGERERTREVQNVVPFQIAIFTSLVSPDKLQVWGLEQQRLLGKVNLLAFHP